MRIVLLGLPGSGKGTQGKKLSEVLGIPHISIGDCVREILKTDTPLAKEIKDFHSDKWKPLPDSLANKIFQEFSQVDCIVDGFPRNVEQLKVFDPQAVDRFIYLEISEKESCDRVLKRNRSDDALLFWQARMEVERSRLPALINATNAITINAEKHEDRVFQEIKCFINLRQANQPAP